MPLASWPSLNSNNPHLMDRCSCWLLLPLPSTSLLLLLLNLANSSNDEVWHKSSKKKKISVKFLTNTMEELTDHGNFIYTGNLKWFVEGFPRSEC